MSGAGAGCCLSSAPGEGALWFSPTLALYRYLSLKTGHTLEKTLLVFTSRISLNHQKIRMCCSG